MVPPTLCTNKYSKELKQLRVIRVIWALSDEKVLKILRSFQNLDEVLSFSELSGRAKITASQDMTKAVKSSVNASLMEKVLRTPRLGELGNPVWSFYQLTKAGKVVRSALDSYSKYAEGLTSLLELSKGDSERLYEEGILLRWKIVEELDKKPYGLSHSELLRRLGGYINTPSVLTYHLRRLSHLVRYDRNSQKYVIRSDLRYKPALRMLKYLNKLSRGVL